MFRLIVREIKGAWDQLNPIHVSQFPAYLGYTVYQSEYDALKEECDRAHKLNEELELLRKNAFAAYDQQVEKNTDLRARLKKRDELITKLANDLQAANDTIERLSIENDVLTKAARKRKPAARPRTTGARNKKVEVA